MKNKEISKISWINRNGSLHIVNQATHTHTIYKYNEIQKKWRKTITDNRRHHISDMGERTEVKIQKSHIKFASCQTMKPINKTYN